MANLDRLDRLFILVSLLLQLDLVIFFALRLWAFQAAMMFGWVIYGSSIPAVVTSMVLIKGRKAWYFIAPGFLYAIWALFGFLVDSIYHILWRSPLYWPIFLPYVGLYLAGIMFYWWPLLKIHRPAWFVYALLYLLSTVLNLASH